jgi:hypothetical protein
MIPAKHPDNIFEAAPITVTELWYNIGNFAQKSQIGGSFETPVFKLCDH